MESVELGQRIIRRLSSLAVMALVVVALVACGGGSSSSSNGGTKQAGGTAYWAEAPQATPNYIFPFAQFAYFSVANLTQFQNLMYRPLYWFGKGAAPVLDPARSLASNPVYSNGQHRRHRQAQGLEVVERRDDHGAERRLLAEHDAGREDRLGRLRARHDPGRHQVDLGERHDARRSR